jgi:hypothetical protein
VPAQLSLSLLCNPLKHRHTAPGRAFSHTTLVNFREEDQDFMCDALQVRWTITAQTAPEPWIACSGCGGPRAFRSSGKIRLNANGRRLDAWLIYNCRDCGRSWNRPLFERRAVREIDPGVLAALQSNDPRWAQREAFNLDALRRKSPRIDEFPEVEIAKAIVRDSGSSLNIAIELVVPFPTSMRLDRLLASELAVSRTRLQALQDQGVLRIASDRTDVLRRRVGTGMIVTLDLSAEADRALFWRLRAIGAAP